MKKSIIFSIVIATIICSCNPGTQKEAAIDTDKPAMVSGNFGASVEETHVVSVSQMYETLKSSGKFEGKVIGEIKEVCVNKGCWMTLSLPDGKDMRVTFKDYGFFVPTNSKGYAVIIEGSANKTLTDVATLRHYAEDAGKSKEEIEAIIAPKEEFAFEAVGVIIKENA